MTNHVLLNNLAHRDMRVITRYAAEFGDNVHAVLTFPTEYGDVQREYPILFRKDAGGEFQSIALLGLAQGENLFLDHGQWKASYVPGIVARGPFLIGFQEQEVDGETRKEPVIHVDLDNPRVNESEGEAVFLQHGGNTPYLERIASILRGIQEGVAMSKAMFAAFESHDLLEPVKIEAEVLTDVKYVLKGFHTINQDRLAQLDGEALENLNKAGFLQGAFLAVASLNNVKKLIDMKQQRVAATQ
ncbi:MAG TPA: SapC family protein [Woeseiaceae bacterium]|nr:SapC family protein [Woeseiaceae bacterium]